VLLGILISSCTSRIETGAIEGRVSGASDLYFGQGALSTESKILAVPNANITIKNASAGVVRTIQTDFSGNFRLEGIPPGGYEISFAAAPFEPQARRMDVRPGETIDASTRMLTSRDVDRNIVSISGCPARLTGGVIPSELISVEIRLRRTACYGPCPVYNIHLYGDGRVEYQGDRYVSALGIRKYRVAPPTVAGLARRFFEKGFFNFCASYRQPATDLPAVETTIQLAGVTKTVLVYGDAAPEGLEDLDAQIENVAHVAQLVKSAQRLE
jgi:hypothetical protein